MSELNEPAVSEDKGKNPLEGIGGWLLVALISLIYSVAAQTVRAWSLATEYFADPQNFAGLNIHSLPFFNPVLNSIATALEVGLLCAIYPLAIVSLILFLQRKRITRQLMMALYGLSALVGLIELVRELYTTGFFWFVMGVVRSPRGPIIYLVLFAIPLAWFRYFQVSRRVEATFII